MKQYWHTHSGPGRAPPVAEREVLCRTGIVNDRLAGGAATRAAHAPTAVAGVRHAAQVLVDERRQRRPAVTRLHAHLANDVCAVPALAATRVRES